MSSSAEKREKAFGLWLDGMSHAEIAAQLGVASSTVSRWASRDNWASKKKERINKANDSIAVKFEKKIISCAEQYFDIAILVAAICRKKLANARYEDNPDISQIVMDAQRGAQIFKAVMPDAPENVAKQIAEELRQLNANRE